MLENRAYSFMELIVVVLLAVAVAALGLIEGRSWLDHYSLSLSGELLASELMAARSRAISVKWPNIVATSETRDSYGSSFWQAIPGRWTVLPRGVSIEEAPSVPLTFYCRGTAAPAASYVLRSRAGELRVIVSPLGRVRREWVP